MRRALCLVGMAFALMGCDPDEAVQNINDFFAGKPCRDDCLSSNHWQNCQNCRCSEAQRSIPEHVCCQGSFCKKPPAEVQPLCGLPDDGQLHLEIQGLQANPFWPKCGVEFHILWRYKNRSSGEMKVPSYYGFQATQLQVLETAVSSNPPPYEKFVEIPWLMTVPPCGTDEHNIPWEALTPKFSTVGTYSMAFFHVPADTIGAFGTSFDIDSGEDDDMCPNP